MKLMVALRDRSVDLFDYTGSILNLRYKSNGSVKAIELAHGSRTLFIKIDKSLRRSLAVELQPGMAVRIAGDCKLDKYGFPKLKGDRLWVLTAPHSLPADGRVNPSSSVAQLEDHRHSPAAHGVSSPPCPSPTKPTQASPEATILVCRKSTCKKRGSLAICAAIESAIRDREHAGKVNVKQVGCLKRCKAGPNLVFLPDKTRYSEVSPRDVPNLLDQHLQ